MAAVSSSFVVWFLILLLSSAIALARGQTVQTFTYVNEGEFGPYITEYDASYRVLPVASSPFQFAFYNTTPGAFYLALRMGTVRSESLFRWVWEANRGRPVGENATFSLLSSGDLVLAEADGRVVWSTGTANRGVVGFRLLPTGNVVLYDAKGRFVWQSFDHPTDTLLVGQSLRLRGPNKLVSRRSVVDGSFGIYSLVFSPGGITLYINSVAARPLAYYNYSDGLLSFSGESVTFVCEPETEDAFAWECRLIINLARPKYNATLSFLRLDVDGNLAVYTYYDPVDTQAWERTFAFFDDARGWLAGCALPSRCGELGVCEDQMCVACPSRGGLVGWSRGCAPPSLAGCKAGDTAAKYFKVEGVENFLSTYSNGEGKLKVEECRRRCSADCKCRGFLFWENESRCWLTPLLGTLSRVSNSSHVAYVKYLK
ncbi:EP1-like glycoprotein 2 [Zingiber officinale]|uniref:EP1-like glycoprotein 2 n=1 Tax=Zingiber officinale TaxID=94328 RepID=UPI001C4AD445|nr:EP1-like glycoprotein 2 [Zingiber officinale]